MAGKMKRAILFLLISMVLLSGCTSYNLDKAHKQCYQICNESGLDFTDATNLVFPASELVTTFSYTCNCQIRIDTERVTRQKVYVE